MLVKSNHAWILAIALVLAPAMALSLRAADEVPNPQYDAWAKFKPGSSSTITCDTKVGPQEIPVHVETTTTLVSVTDTAVTVETTTKSEVMGHANVIPATKRDIKSTAPARDIKETGTQDVEATGKTYSCKVLEMTGDAAANNAPKSGGPPAAAGKAKLTAYVNHDVPGGIVKMDMVARDGKTMTFILKSVDVK